MSEEERNQILWENAAKLYKLKKTERWSDGVLENWVLENWSMKFWDPHDSTTPLLQYSSCP